ncbi:hypothetical protein J2847_001227 [Azospirillum agricola]|uniref:hypothetical protein n=1 Tax=Azospirillum agricola TaxID=1720247 RepID=UPI001AE118F0|nr:hypothetical protein [Azospirillum agricola]MBP2227945.1 hypothetical protein [Azospirillum agricola]
MEEGCDLRQGGHDRAALRTALRACCNRFNEALGVEIEEGALTLPLARGAGLGIRSQ